MKDEKQAKTTGKVRIICRVNRQGKKRWHFNLVARNGKIVATSEAYNSRNSVVKGIAAVSRVMENPKIVGEG